ncbi:acetylglutamate kinase [Peribacillus psychrosaccharolyticus]|uniref:acetylglutamate kinase n=1 Tax=Peribacillus psychrosaccharolyticus TaxID=1407 RepID=UPI003D2733E6
MEESDSMYYYSMRGMTETCISKSASDLKNHMRMLWEQHVFWTRLTIVSLVFSLLDSDAVVARLLRNSVDMGNLLKPYYGDQAAERYAHLIQEHLVIAADLIKAAKVGDQTTAATLEKKWYANGDEIVAFWYSINPFLPLTDFRKMFYDHLAMTKAEAVYMLQHDYQSSVDVFERIESEALQMADLLSTIIIQQFPSVFLT